MKKTLFVFILMLGFAIVFQEAYEHVKYNVEEMIVSSMSAPIAAEAKTIEPG